MSVPPFSRSSAPLRGTSPSVSVKLGTAVVAPADAHPILRTYRILCVAFAVIYPTFGLLHRLRSTSYDPFWMRLGMAGLVLALGAASLFSPSVRRHFQPAVYGLGFVIGTHMLYLLNRNHFMFEYVLGYVLILVAVGLLFLDLRVLVAYVGFMLAGLVVSGLAAGTRDVDVDIGLVGVVTVTFGLSSYCALWMRLRVTERLHLTNARLEAEIAQREVAQAQAEQAQSAAELALRTAEEASLSKSRFLANMSHELRTPLNSVIGFAVVAAKNKSGNLNDRDVEYMRRIVRNGTHLLGVIDDLLDISNIETGGITVQRGPCPIDEIARTKVDELQAAAQERGVDLVLEAPAGLEPLDSDRERVAQIIGNLVANAIKFTEHGRVTIKIYAEPASQRPVRLQVTDTGIGIAPDHMSSILESFQQVEAGHDRKYGGTGLGLAICHSLCQMLDIELEIESELGRGSTFGLRFPTQSASA